MDKYIQQINSILKDYQLFNKENVNDEKVFRSLIKKLPNYKAGDYGVDNAVNQKVNQLFNSFYRALFPADKYKVFPHKANWFDNDVFVKELATGNTINIISPDYHYLDHLDESTFTCGFWFRTAKDEHDYYGGPNKWSTAEKLKTSVESLFRTGFKEETNADEMEQ